MLTRKTVYIRLSLLFILIVGVFSTSFAQNNMRFYPGMITIKVAESVGDLKAQEGNISFGKEGLDAICNHYQIEKLEKRFKYNESILRDRTDCPDLSRIYRLSFSENTNVQEVVQAFKSDPNIEYAERIPVMYECDVPNDEFYNMEHHLPQVQADDAWDIHHGEDGAEVLIGICDSGIEWKHPDLVENLAQNLGEDIDNDGHVIEYINDEWVFDPDDENGVDDDGNGFVDDFVGWNFYTVDGSVENDPNGSSVNLHGTHITGIAAGRTNNNTGISSISWNVKFLPTKHSMNYLIWPPGIIYNAYDGVIYLAEMGCDIINCSWGGDGYSNAHQDALAYARSLGSIIVAASGNSASDSPLFFPASYPGVISVTSVIPSDELATYANYGIGIDISAPGGGGGSDRIYSTVPPSEYCYGNGTSMACALVSGLLTSLKSYHPDWDNDQLIYQVIGTADDIDQYNAGYENMLGSGRINAYRAFTETGVTVPQELRLELASWSDFNDSNNNHILESGETVSLGLTLRNYAHYVSSDNVQLTLTTNDPDITILNGSYTGSVAADGNTVFEDIFSIQIASNATSHEFEMNVQISADIDITHGSEFSCTAYIEPNNILVWDGGFNENNTLHFSGEFIADYLQEQNIEYIYTTEFPISLNGFDAVFLCFGNYGLAAEDYPFTGLEAQTVINYLQNGGYLYLEGGSTLGYYQSDNADLLSLLGIEIQDSGDDEVGIADLIGQDNSVAEYLTFFRTNQLPRNFIDRYLPYDSGITSMILADYGNVAVQNEGTNGQKTYCSSYSLVGFQDQPGFSKRRFLLARILDFFEFPVFEASCKVEYPQNFVPHVPVTLSFFDQSLSTSPITSWEWDFDNDGTIDSYEQNPIWTFTEPGYQFASLEVSDGIETSSCQGNNFAYFFNGESALTFGSSNTSLCNATIPAAPSLNLNSSFTIEAWIKPNMWGNDFELDYPIFNKGSISLLPSLMNLAPYEECLVLWTEHANGECYSYTPSFSIQLDTWQHVAVSYDGQSVFKVYINGAEQTLFQSASPQGAISNNENYNLVLGNIAVVDSLLPRVPYEGDIDEVRVWNDVRTSNEINVNKDIALQGSEAGLIGYWNLNEAIGDEIHDLTVNQNNGSLLGTNWTDGAITPLTSIQNENPVLPVSSQLYCNYPNPFNPTTTISFSTTDSSENTEICIYNLKGQKVKTLLNEVVPAGQHSIVWNGRNEYGKSVSSGVYFYKMKKGNYQETKRMLLLK
jgi:hypothetical protein